ncbi:hypothetical protein HNP40_003817 [Mycobacteroides chelonae]|nr:hypothetical protein [Mycobacteroides chelonae]
MRVIRYRVVVERCRVVHGGWRMMIRHGVRMPCTTGCFDGSVHRWWWFVVSEWAVCECVSFGAGEVAE